MRALVCSEYGPPESLSLQTLDDPVAGRGEVVVDVRAAGINFPDVLSIAGKYQVKSATPFVPGNEAAGIVSQIGDDVGGFAVGDKVVVTLRGGAFAEKCVAAATACFPLPAGLGFEQGAAFAVTYGTSYHALKQCANLQAGESVLVLGAAGGVGSAAIDLAKCLGAKVIAVVSDAAKAAFARQIGADEVVIYTRESLRDRLKELTGGRGVDVVVDPVGGETAIIALRALAWHGRHLVIGFASGEIPAFPANIALLKEASIVGVWWGTWAEKNPRDQAANMRTLSTLCSSGKLNPHITQAFPLEAFAEAFKSITGRQVLGKVVFAV